MKLVVLGCAFLICGAIFLATFVLAPTMNQMPPVNIFAYVSFIIGIIFTVIGFVSKKDNN